jgi:hypothetical protein
LQQNRPDADIVFESCTYCRLSRVVTHFEI